MITKPMLASKVTEFSETDKRPDLSTIKYPVLCTPKLDGIRCLKIKGKALSRTFKPIRNDHSRKLVEYHFPDGVDGELMIEGNFQAVSSAVMKKTGEPPISYYVFDYVGANYELMDEPYERRVEALKELKRALGMVPGTLFRAVLPTLVRNEKELLEFEKDCLDKGFEGVILRDPKGPYKCGRSTANEGYLLKLKRFEDAEAIIIGFEEEMHNANEAIEDVQGHAKRSHHKDNMIPKGTLGAFVVKSKEFKEKFNVGSGLNDAQKQEYWKTRDKLIGKIIKFKYQVIGTKDVPRIPVFLGFRDKRDM